ncbi:MAG: 3'(2'),5'-bisphosphate nucleotidase CysQ [Pseudomonadales bacterium]
MVVLGVQERLALADRVAALCQQAGEAITAIYLSSQPLVVEQKADSSPVTVADLESHQIIVKGLSQLAPSCPILSEEQSIPSFAERSQWARYWLVDPLDGTKEFIGRTGEFTINIALIEQGLPVLGVVYLPLVKIAYIGVAGESAWREDAMGRVELRVNDRGQDEKVRVLTSSRHKGEYLQACLDRLEQHFGGVERIKVGSALKFCHLAEGLGDIYPRFSPCSEWDTAAGQAVLEAAGGQLVDIDFRRFSYNYKESLINPHFYAFGAANVDWRAVLDG